MAPSARAPSKCRGCPLGALIPRWRCLPWGLLAAGLLCLCLCLCLRLCLWLGAPHMHTHTYTPPRGPLAPLRGERNIIFIETTCAVENASWSGLTWRQACAVESAARHHAMRRVHVQHTWRVHVLHTCPAPPSGLRLPAGAAAHHVSLSSLLEGWGGQPPSRQWVREALCWAALGQHGGLYLDLGLMVLRPLWALGEDWAVAEDGRAVGGRAMALSARPGSAGAQVAAQCLQALRRRPWQPDTLATVLRRRCGAKQTAAMADCGGFRVLPAGAFFPANCTPWQLYFSDQFADATLARLRRAFAVQVWNREARLSLRTAPHSAFARAARQHCPRAYRRTMHHR